MWRLALGGVFLAAAQACVFCRLPAHDLSGRLARLCSRMEAGQKECGASPDFSAFALGGSTTLYNCSTCKGMEVSCWPRKRCFPGSQDLWEAKILLLSVFGAVLLLGVLSLLVESHHLQAKSGL
ncbi:sperm-egg fusion protein TMEM95 isoform X3 [Macaca fascicularis]|uniref:sperm-egg fusion protein TMEM95 isoform X3 n=1 Tax=Macaca fascicularis TaxID=9541 RepID=UPI003D15F21A